MNIFCPNFTKPNIVLAPMDGLTDPLMRKILTQSAQDFGTPFDWAVSEFVRITHHVLPKSVFLSAVPELTNKGRTDCGTPVQVQILGSDPDLMAANAHALQKLGAWAVDINFGCPAKTVNRHKGGAVLLNEPESLYQIVKSTVSACQIPISAKVRLGYESSAHFNEICHAIKDGGASWLTIHARTKSQGYAPPAHWHLARFDGMHTIINGDIFNPQSAVQARKHANTEHIMLGRGAIMTPDLGAQISGYAPKDWQDFIPLQIKFLQDDTNNTHGLVGRYKQWLGMLSLAHPQAKALFNQIKKLKKVDDILAQLGK